MERSVVRKGSGVDDSQSVRESCAVLLTDPSGEVAASSSASDSC